MSILYQFLISIANFLIPVVSLFDKNISHWWQTRKRQKIPGDLKDCIWIHCASLGEFEQGRPVIEAIKKEWPEQKLALTFFSMSGYDVRKNYPLVNWVGCLPLDTPGNAKDIIQELNPKLAIFVKYEYWYNHLAALSNKQTPFIFISSHWWPQMYLLKPWYGFLLNKVLLANATFVQDPGSKEILDTLHAKNVMVNGDTRIDRVIQIKKENQKLPPFENISRNSKIIIAGSTWPQDEKLLWEFYKLNQQLKLILVPHDPNRSAVNDILRQFGAYHPIKFSDWDTNDFNVLVIDRVGILNTLYAYGDLAYIGGGFGKGIHNTLEPAVYGLPVFFGPNYQKFKEARDFIQMGIGQAIQTAEEMNDVLHATILPNLDHIKVKAEEYFKANAGATNKIIDYLRPFLSQ